MKIGYIGLGALGGQLARRFSFQVQQGTGRWI